MKNQLSFIALVLTTSFTFAQSAPASASTFAGSADAYYKYDFSGIDNSLTSFTNSHNSFELEWRLLKLHIKWIKPLFC
jgi:hypothetical protein